MGRVESVRTFAKVFLAFLVLGSAQKSFAQVGEKLASAETISNSLLQDLNGDGIVRTIAFGDSITRGIGDFTAPGQSDELTQPRDGQEAGYPLRLEGFFGVSVENFGIPGEQVAVEGLDRFAHEIPAIRPDVVMISEGANDALRSLPAGAYFHYIQAMVNIARVSGSQPIVGTINPTCCNHVPVEGLIRAYNAVVRRVGLFNSIPVFDTDRAFRNTCEVPTCFLLNLPDGLHPNSAGYDVISECASAALLDIDLFAPEGPAELETALGLPVGGVRTKPDVVPPAE